MSDTYLRLPTPVKAWRFDGQPQKDWPEWVNEHRVSTNMGFLPIGLGAGVLLIPTESGVTTNVVAGQWLVLENGVITRYKPEKFAETFAAADPLAAVESAPAAEPVRTIAEPEPVPEVKTKAKAATPEPVAEPEVVAEEPPAAEESTDA